MAGISRRRGDLEAVEVQVTDHARRTPTVSFEIDGNLYPPVRHVPVSGTRYHIPYAIQHLALYRGRINGDIAEFFFVLIEMHVDQSPVPVAFPCETNVFDLCKGTGLYQGSC